MNTILKISAVVLMTIVLGACSASREQKRNVYAGQDHVGQINKDMLVGHWEVTILNPIEGENQKYKPIAHYSADGSLSVDAKFDSGIGEIELEVIGTWAVAGDTVEQVATDVRQKSNSSVAMLVKLFKGMMLKNANAKLNVYEASADRLLIVSSEGQAQEFNRIK